MEVECSNLRKPDFFRTMAFWVLFIAINLYTMLAPIRIFFSSTIYLSLEILLLLLMVCLIMINIILKPKLLIDFDIELFLVFLFFLFLTIGTLIMRSDSSIEDLARHLRLAIAPLIASILALTSQFESTTLSRKKIWLYVPIIPIGLALLSSIVQLIKADIIKSIFTSNPEFLFTGSGTNFISGSIHNRLLGIFLDPNLYGGFLVLNIIFIILYYNNKNKISLGIKIAIPLFIFLILTISRSALVTACLCIVVYVVMSINLQKIIPGKYLKNFVRVIFIGAIVVLIMIYIFQTSNMSILDLLQARFFIGFNEFITLNGRTDDWVQYLSVFNESPWMFIFGVDSVWLNYYLNAAIENTFVGFLIKYGILCFVFGSLYIIRLLHRAEVNRTTKAVILTYIVLSCYASDIDTLQHITAPLFIYLALSNSKKSPT